MVYEYTAFLPLYIFGPDHFTLVTSTLNCSLIGTKMDISLESLPPPPAPRLRSASIRIDDNIYVTGGRIESRLCQTMDCYNIGTRLWSTGPPMKFARAYHSIVQLPNCASFIVIGGIGGYNVRHSSCEIYDTITKSWVETSPLLQARYGHSSVTLDVNIYTFAGYNDNGVCESCEKYNTNPKEWTAITPLWGQGGTKANVISPDSIVLFGWGQRGARRAPMQIRLYKPSTDVWDDKFKRMEGLCSILDLQASQSGKYQHYLQHGLFGCIYDNAANALMVIANGPTSISILCQSFQTNEWSNCSTSLSHMLDYCC